MEPTPLVEGGEDALRGKMDHGLSLGLLFFPFSIITSEMLRSTLDIMVSLDYRNPGGLSPKATMRLDRH